MTSQKNNPESGQVLILLVLAMVVLFGFLALAIDGGMVYADRRVAQNAADAAALAGVGKAALDLKDMTSGEWDCGTGEISSARVNARLAAQARAASNNFNIELDLSNQNGVATTCTNNGGSADYIDVKVMITFQTETAFAHLVFNGPLKNTVEAVARLRPRQSLALGNAIVALNDKTNCAPKTGADFRGSAIVDVKGGGIFSNGCLQEEGNKVSVDVTNGSINYVGDLDNKHDVFTPDPSHIGFIIPPDEYWVEPPDCSGLPNRGQAKNVSGLIQPGNYSLIKTKGDAQLVAGGLYCLTGDFDTSNANVSINTSNGKSGVTIYLESGDFITTGNGDVVLNAPPDDSYPLFPVIPGILVYLDPNNDGQVKLRGNSSSMYTGTILAPGGTIDAAGNTDTDAPIHAQLIGWDVLIGGNADTNIVYNASENHTLPTTLEVSK